MARKQNSQTISRAIPAIIGAGITEKYYFDHLKSVLGVQYKIRPRFFGSESIFDIEKNIEKVLQEDRMAICVFDADVSERNEAEKKRLLKLQQKYAKNKNVILCDSLPSIEYWFLLHYVNTNKQFKNEKDVERELRKFITQYIKKEKFLENEKWVMDLCADGKLETALQRAKLFSEMNGSYSNIYKLFEYLKLEGAKLQKMT